MSSDSIGTADRPRRKARSISRRSYVYRAGLLSAAVALSLAAMSSGSSASVRTNRAGRAIAGGTATYA
ncbi:MAG: hypothetical protein ACYCVV_19900, partial [Acidimicrobiales bacterium]